MGIRRKGAGQRGHIVLIALSITLSLSPSLSAFILWAALPSPRSAMLLSDHRILTDTDGQTETDWAGMGNSIAARETIMPYCAMNYWRHE